MSFKYLAIILSGLMLAGSCLAYDNDFTHQQLVNETARVWNENQSRRLAPEEIRYLIQGARLEDSPEWRSVNHFLDPFNGGLSLGADLKIGQGLDEWSNSQEVIIFDRSDTWQGAIDDYTAGRKQAAFQKLGAILHLLADTGLPAHTRNDEHLLGDAYESWIKQMQISNPSLLKIKAEKLPSVKCTNYQACLKQMAIFTNRHFFSGDTISNKRFYEPYNSMSLRSDGYVYANGFEVAKWDSASESFVLNDRVHLTNWRVLEPMIVAYGQEILKKFFVEVRDPKVLGLKIKPRIGTGLKIVASPSDLIDDEWPIPIVDASLEIPIEFSRPKFENVISGSSVPTPSSATGSGTTTTGGRDDQNGDGNQGVGNDDGGGTTTSTDDGTSTSTDPIGDDGTSTSTDPIGDDGTSTSTDPIGDDGTSTSTDPIGDDGTSTSTPTSTPDRYTSLLDGLFGLWHFNEAAGPLAINAVTGSVALNMKGSWTTGRYGGGVTQTDDINQGIGALLSSEFPTGELTLAIWFQDISDYPINSSRSRIVMSHNGLKPIVGISPNFLYNDYWFNGERNVFVSAMPLDHLWHLVTITYSATNLIFYIDGLATEKIPGDFSVPNGLNVIEIVGENAPSGFDELVIWNRALYPEEIAGWFASDLELAP